MGLFITPMSQTVNYASLILCIFLLLTGIAHWLHSKHKFPVDASRKFLHITGGLLSLSMPLLLPSHWWALALCSLAFLVLLITSLMNYLEGIHGTERKSVGSVIFPIPVYICFFFAEKWSNSLLFYLPILLLALADPMAEWGGKKWGHLGRSFFNHQKTLAGTLCFAFTAVVINIGICIAYNKTATQIIAICVAVTFISSVAELVTLKGWDNLSIPLTSLITLLLIN